MSRPFELKGLFLALKVLALIHHEVAGAGVFPEVVTQLGHELEFWTPSEEPLPRSLTDYGAVIAFGGGMQADQEDVHPWLLTALGALSQCLDEGMPTLGVCLGGQMLARAAGGRVGPAPRAECGWAAVELTDEGLADPLFSGLPRVFDVYQWHSYGSACRRGRYRLHAARCRSSASESARVRGACNGTRR